MEFDVKKLIFLLPLATMLVACNENNTKMRTSLSESATAGCSGDSVASSNEGPLFKLDGKVMTRGDLPKNTREMIFQNEFEAYSKNQNIFKEYALRIHLAQKAGKLEDINNPPQLIDLLNIPEPSEKEMKALFDQHKERMPKGVKFETMKDQIAGFIKSQKIGGVFQEEIKKMEASGAYLSLIAGPVAPEMELNLAGHPNLGNKSASIQVVEVSDYTCGHCQHAHPEVKKILKKFEGKINFTQLNFALRPDGLSGKYVMGAYCAQKQGMDKFWEYHHLAFEETSKPHDHNAPGHNHETKPEEDKKTVVSVATSAKLNVSDFTKCIDSKEATDFVMNTVKELSEQGISGTPVFLVNNKKLMGGVEELEKAINELL